MMSDLDIYDSPLATRQHDSLKHGYFRRTFDDYKSKISKEVNQNKDTVFNAEQKVLTTIQPVTKYIPITYDTVKRVSIISLCTFSGLLQGRSRGGYKRLLYPALCFMGGNFACYPKQTYYITSKALTNGLPLVASAGKATFEGTAAVVYQTNRSASSIYEKYVKQPVSDESVPESTSPKVESLDVTQCQSAEASEDFEISITELEDDKSEEPPVTVHEELNEGASDKIIPLEELSSTAEDVVPIEGSLGMGDKEHNDMYSTRSTRS